MKKTRPTFHNGHSLSSCAANDQDSFRSVWHDAISSLESDLRKCLIEVIELNLFVNWFGYSFNTEQADRSYISIYHVSPSAIRTIAWHWSLDYRSHRILWANILMEASNDKFSDWVCAGQGLTTSLFHEISQLGDLFCQLYSIKRNSMPDLALQVKRRIDYWSSCSYDAQWSPLKAEATLGELPITDQLQLLAAVGAEAMTKWIIDYWSSISYETQQDVVGGRGYD